MTLDELRSMLVGQKIIHPISGNYGKVLDVVWSGNSDEVLVFILGNSTHWEELYSGEYLRNTNRYKFFDMFFRHTIKITNSHLYKLVSR